MKPNDFGHQTDSLHLRLQSLHKQIIETSLPAQEQAQLAASFKEVFFTTMEELHVTEEELSQQNEELMAARVDLEIERRRYMELFEFAPDAYLVTDPAGIIQEANRAATELLNLPQPFLIGKPFSVYIAEPSWRIFRMALRSLDTIEKLPERIVRVAPRNKPPFEASITAAAVRDGDKKVVAVRWLVRDASERVREQDQIANLNTDLEKRVAARTAELEEANRAKDELLAREMAARAEAETANTAKDHFLAVLSHELRTPLTPVVMTVAVLESDESLPGQVREDLAMVRRNIELETKLIDDLLDLSRITHGKVRLHTQTVDAHDLVGRVLDMCESDITGKRLRISKDLAAMHPFVNADPARLQQILWNLVKNAIKFTPNSGEVNIRTINCQTDPPGSAQTSPKSGDSVSCRRLVIEVRDTGIGIEPQTLPRIFDAFEQGEKTVTRRFGGLGLGLSISRALANLHGGTLHAHSAGKDKGATFTLDLPAQVAPIPSQFATRELPPPAPDHRATRVLLVEDHADTARMLARLLRSSGYDVKTASTVADALQLSGSEPFDILVSDLGLPDGSGLDLMREIRARGPLSGIALTGFGMDTDVKATDDAGFAEHLTKPVNLRALELAIDRLASRKPTPA